MRHCILTIIFILTLTINSKIYGQGRVDTDPILHNIWWTTQKVDRNLNLKKEIKKYKNSFGTSFKIYFFNSDTLCKILELGKTYNGTEQTLYYFDKGKPIYISVDRNNFKLSDNIQFVNEAINSFDQTIDTLVNQQAHFIEQYTSSYYFYKDKVHFAAVIIYSDQGQIKNVRHDNKNDIKQGMSLYMSGMNKKLSDK